MLGLTVELVGEKKSKDILEKLTNKNAVKFNPLPYLNELPLSEVKEILTKDQLEKFKGKENFLFIKILEQDNTIFEKLNLTEIQKMKISRMFENEDYLTKISTLRFEYISKILKAITVKKGRQCLWKTQN